MSQSGNWADSCQSSVSGRGYARYYTFTLAGDAGVTIDLSSSLDTYLYLRAGSATSGTFLHDNDDIVSGNTNAQIVAELEAGTYTAEATTRNEAKTGSFTLNVSAEPGTPVVTDCTPTTLTLPASGVSGAWANDCQSSVSGRGYARYYTFTLDQGTEVTIDLTSEVNTYLYLKSGSATSGTSLHSNDDIASDNTNSQIVADLEAGSYSIEATTHDEETTGSFALSVSEDGCTPAPLTLPASEATGAWGDDCQSSVSGRGYARYYTFTLAEDAGVTIDLTSEVDTHLYLRSGSATSGTSLHSNDDIASDNTNSQIVADLEADSYTVEATTRDEGITGSFTLTVSSAQTTAAAATFPSEPLSVAVERGGTGELDVSWEEPGSNGGSAITGYKVQWKEAANSWHSLGCIRSNDNKHHLHHHQPEPRGGVLRSGDRHELGRRRSSVIGSEGDGGRANLPATGSHSEQPGHRIAHYQRKTGGGADSLCGDIWNRGR